jgi:hypothetical protein
MQRLRLMLRQVRFSGGRSGQADPRTGGPRVVLAAYPCRLSTSPDLNPEPCYLEERQERNSFELYRLKRRWRDGTNHMIFQPLELIEKGAS